MGIPVSFENHERLQMQFSDRNDVGLVKKSKDRSVLMTSETRDGGDLGLLRFNIEEYCEIQLPISLSYSQYKKIYYYYSFMDVISNTGGLVAMAKFSVAIIVPIKMYYFMIGLTTLVKRKNELEIQAMIFKNILEFLP